jgi:hypothetical protein
LTSREKRRCHDLAHHAEIIAGREGRSILDVELAVLVFHEPFRPGDDHAADRIGAHDVGVVVDLDPARRGVEVRMLRPALPAAWFGWRCRQAYGPGLTRIGRRVGDQIALFAALGFADLDSCAPRAD